MMHSREGVVALYRAEFGCLDEGLRRQSTCCQLRSLSRVATAARCWGRHTRSGEVNVSANADWDIGRQPWIT